MVRFFALGCLLQSHGNQVEAIQVCFFIFIHLFSKSHGPNIYMQLQNLFPSSRLG